MLGERPHSGHRGHECQHDPTFIVATSLWAKCEGEAHTPKSGNLESSRTPKNSELDCRGQISLHLSVLGVIGNFLKCRCPKWPRMCHLDIFSPSYAQKMGSKSQELTSSRCLQKECNMALKRSQRELQLWFRPSSSRMLQLGDMSSQSPGTPTRDNFGTPPWESREKEPFGCSLGGEL
jgi:hypothetical protein